MSLYLKVLSGSQKGSKFAIRPGFKIGRNAGDIIIADKKISSYHAQIEEKDGKLVLFDRNSANGMYIKNTRVKSIMIMLGVKFTLGRTVFEVVEVSADDEATRFAKSQIVDRESGRGWFDVLIEEVANAVAKNNTDVSQVTSFEQPILLQFISGPQMDKTITLGYGPRRFGSKVLDVELEDQSLPSVSFEIFSDSGKPRFSTYFADTVKLNNQNVSDVILKENDIILVGKSEIRVSFLKI